MLRQPGKLGEIEELKGCRNHYGEEYGAESGACGAKQKAQGESAKQQKHGKEKEGEGGKEATEISCKD